MGKKVPVCLASYGFCNVACTCSLMQGAHVALLLAFIMGAYLCTTIHTSLLVRPFTKCKQKEAAESDFLKNHKEQPCRSRRGRRGHQHKDKDFVSLPPRRLPTGHLLKSIINAGTLATAASS